MPRISAAFFTVGVICLVIGMLAGIHMAATQNFVTAPAHAHLNLLGWVTMALYGTFYALTANTLSPRLAWTHFALSLLGVALMIPGLFLMLLNGHDPAYEPIVAVGSILSLLGLLVFAVSVVREMLRPR